MDCGLQGSSVHGIPRQEHWDGLPVPSPGDLPDPGIEPPSVSPAVVLTASATWEALYLGVSCTVFFFFVISLKEELTYVFQDDCLEQFTEPSGKLRAQKWERKI